MAEKYKFQFYLLLVILVGYWQFTCFQSALLFDNIDVALASKYFAGTCLQNGDLPLWNPYQLFGFPAHADLQYTNWNIEVMIIGILKGYDYTTLHILYMTYLYIGALGMFYLIKHIAKSPLIGFYISTIYILSGLFTAHSQSLVTILGLVWLPYVILYFLKWLDKPSLKLSLLSAIFIYLFFTLGYQAFSFMIMPVLISLFIIKLYTLFKNKEQPFIYPYLGWGMVMLLSVIILLSPVLISQLQSKAFVARLSGLSVEQAMFNPFPPQALISLLNPIFTVGHDALFNTDVTMRNIFIGIIPLILLIISLFKKNKSAFEITLLFFSFLFLLASFGDYTPVRKALYYILPGFNLFRFPALIRVISVVCLLLYLAKNFHYSVKLFFNNPKLRWTLLSFVGIGAIVSAIYFYLKIEVFQIFDSTELNFNALVLHCSVNEIGFYYSILQLLFLISCVLVLRVKSYKVFFKRIFFLLFIELCFTITIYGQYVTYSISKPVTYQNAFKKLTPNFPTPSQDPISSNSAKFEHINEFWKNTGSFKKQLIINDEWTSFLFSNYVILSDKYPTLKDSLMSYPFIYFSKPNATEYQIDKNANETLVEKSFHYQNKQATYTYKDYAPNHIVIECDVNEELIVNIQQSYYTGWTLRVDGKLTPLLWNAGFLMSAPIHKGTHIVELEYHNSMFTNSLILSYVFLICIIFILIVICYSKNKRLLFLALYMGFIALISSSFYRHHKNPKAISKNEIILIGNKTIKMDVYLNNKKDYQKIWDSITVYKPTSITYNWKNFYNTPEFLFSLGYCQQEEQDVSKGQIMIDKQTQTKNNLLFKEIYSKNYENKTFLDSTNNQYSLLLVADINPYAGAQIIKGSTIKKQNIYGFVNLKTHRGPCPVVACFIKHSNGKEEQLYFPLDKYLITNDTFQKIPYYFNIKDKTNDDDEIKIFLMNQSQTPSFIKSFEGVSF